MTCFYLRLTLLPVVLFTVILLVVHAQPYDDHELRQLMSPDGCPAPCFMGIRPGVTTQAEAIKILEATGWVERIEQDATTMSVKWNGSSPAWLSKDGAFSGTTFWIEEGLVTQFVLETNLMIGDIHLSLGPPAFQHISLNNLTGHPFLFYVVVYPDEDVNISTSPDCDQHKGNITYRDKVYLNYSQTKTGDFFPPTYHRSWLDVIRTACR